MWHLISEYAVTSLRPDSDQSNRFWTGKNMTGGLFTGVCMVKATFDSKLPYKFYVLGQIGLSKQCRPRSDCF